jgi:hypothetical protein
MFTDIMAIGSLVYLILFIRNKIFIAIVFFYNFNHSSYIKKQKKFKLLLQV